MHLIQSGHFRDKQILIIDKDAKSKNDRTWCFWEKEQGIFQNIVHKEWRELQFYSDCVDKRLDIVPYTYKLIRGIDFYTHCLSAISSHQNFTFLQASVDDIFSNAVETGVMINGQKVKCKYVFNSIMFERPVLMANHYWLLQHFKGWFLEADSAPFDPNIGTLMDFRTDQSNGSTFFYVLPFSKTEALVEYTLFSPQVLADHQYEEALDHYVKKKLGIERFIVKEREFGTIPMTNFRFRFRNNNIINMGTAGGQTKASSGYTFRFIQKQVSEIVQSLHHHGHPFHVKQQGGRFHFYDSVLLNILQHRKMEGAYIFSKLFDRNKASRILKFLDNETSLTEEMKILSTLPTIPFTKAAASHFKA